MPHSPETRDVELDIEGIYAETINKLLLVIQEPDREGQDKTTLGLSILDQAKGQIVEYTSKNLVNDLLTVGLDAFFPVGETPRGPVTLTVVSGTVEDDPKYGKEHKMIRPRMAVQNLLYSRAIQIGIDPEGKNVEGNRMAHSIREATLRRFLEEVRLRAFYELASNSNDPKVTGALENAGVTIQRRPTTGKGEEKYIISSTTNN